MDGRKAPYTLGDVTQWFRSNARGCFAGIIDEVTVERIQVPNRDRRDCPLFGRAPAMVETYAVAFRGLRQKLPAHAHPCDVWNLLRGIEFGLRAAERQATVA